MTVGIFLLQSAVLALFSVITWRARAENEALRKEFVTAVAALKETMLERSAHLRTDIIDRIDQKLNEYVAKQQFKDYVEGHAREHQQIQEFMTRHRDWKHGLEPEIRGFQMKIEDLQNDIAALKQK